MAHFTSELPVELMNQISALERDTTKMIDAMVEAGAEVAMSNLKKNAPDQLRKYTTPQYLSKTRVYTTPSNGARKCYIYFGGYFTNRKGQKTPLELVCNMFEYGSQKREYPKHPFLRKTFNHKREIEKAMLEAQSKFIKEGG